MHQFRSHTCYSPDDGGWYAEVYSLKTGETLYQTRICDTERKAQIDANYWIEDAVIAKAKGQHAPT